MVARSQSSLLRRSSRRGEQALSPAAVTNTHPQPPPPPPGAIALSHRAKRNRISSISDTEKLEKRRKIEHFETASEHKVPFCSRPNPEPLRSLPVKNRTKPVSLRQERETVITRNPHNPPHTNQPAQDKSSRQHSQQGNDKRSLRSQDGGSRSKSELSLYFTNYEHMLSLEPAKPGTHAYSGFDQSAY